MMNVPRVDVLIPAYNAEATITATLDSLCRQSLRDIRILVVNDGSTDATPHLVRAMAERDPRIELVETDNRGIVAARNTALDHARAEYVAWHDADDIALPERLALQLAYLDAHPDCAGVGGESWFIDAQGVRTGYRVRIGGEAPGDLRALPAKEPWIGPFMMTRTTLMKALGGYRDAHFAEDTDLYWRLSDEGRLYNLPEPIAEYRLHAGSVSGKALMSGRLSACNSQRAAANAARRRRGEADLGFPSDMQRDMSRSTTLAAMVAVASRDMTASEARRYSVAVAAKMVELASYRPYRLSDADSRFVGRQLIRNISRFRLREWALLVGWRLVYKSIRRGRIRQLLMTADPTNALRPEPRGQ